MTYAGNIAIDIFGLILLLLMLFNFGARTLRTRELDDVIFTGMLLVNFALLLTDLFTWVLNGMPGEGARSLNFFINSIYYALQPLMCMMWVLYCEYKLHENPSRLRRLAPLHLVPVLIGFVLVAINSVTPILFSISPDNLYIRSNEFYFVFMSVCLWSFIYTTVITIHSLVSCPQKHPQHSDPRIYLLIYPVFPLVASALQAMFYGIAVTWISTVLSLLIIYFNLQNAQITTDPLTGLNNRRRFEHFMHHRLSNRQPQNVLFLLMIDIDNFKSINDRYGHAAGDNAIRETAALLIRSVCSSDFIARIGGDEFVIVGERRTCDEVAETIQAIQRAPTASPHGTTHPYTLTFSIGCSVLQEGWQKSVDEMLAEADQRMYGEKQSHHTEDSPC